MIRLEDRIIDLQKRVAFLERTLLGKGKECPVCYKTFYKVRNDAVYCSVRCRNIEYRKRKGNRNE